MRRLALALVAVASVAGCATDSSTKSAVEQAAATPASSAAITPTPMPSMEIGGKRYPLPVAECMQKVWDDRVDSWNSLVQERDAKGAENVVVDGVTYAVSDEYFKARGWQTTFEATVKEPATYNACASAR